ncbi:glycosyltransferase [Rhodopirellula bahusiensis]|uniref:glycosyltransferase n=2 Tax=Rhodopirellula bahusiensis TaxID=2014065 RepID=UPI003263095B
MKLKDSHSMLVNAVSPPTTPIARDQPLRIVIVSDAVAGRNGLGTYYLDLIEHLRDQVGHISLIGPTSDRQSELEGMSLPMPGDKTQRMVCPRVAALNRMLDERNPNLVIIPTIGAFSYFGLRYASSRQIPMVIAHHTNFDRLLSLYWPGLVAKPLGWMLRQLNEWLIGQASMVASLNTEAYEDAVALGAQQARIMGTPIATSFLRVPPAPRNDSIRRVIFVGRLAAEKGVEEVLDSARKYPQIEFAIAGDGPGREVVEASASTLRNVRYLGWLSRDRVREELDRSEVLMLPSAIETFGTVALEALARERYVLLRSECGIAKWPSLASGLFYIDEEDSVADSLGKLLAKPVEARDQIARRSWDAVHDFNQHTIRVWLEFLAEAVDRHDAPGLERQAA